MHSAPAVSYPVGRSSLRMAVHVAPWLLAAVVAVLWSVQASAPRAPAVLAALLLAGMGLLLTWRAELRAPSGTLRWDGQDWHWESAVGTRVGRVAPRADWQSGLLLEFRPAQGAGVWIWLERQMAPRSWHALRCAVFARPAPTVGDAADPAAGATS